jgi:hypothetical protein
MMAGSVMDTIDHSDPGGERVTIAHGASRADQVSYKAAADLGKAALRGAGKGSGKSGAGRAASDDAKGEGKE